MDDDMERECRERPSNCKTIGGRRLNMDIVEALQMMRADPNVCVGLGNRLGIYKLIDGELRYWGRNAWVESHIGLNTLLTHRFKVVPDPSIKPMSFMEAVRECENGKDIRRKAWLGDLCIKSSNRDKLIIQSETLSSRTAGLDWSDIIANDWETRQ